ncbi:MULTISPECIES: L,D-transpeptidase [unclassified Mesorhizobium]|jgi:lipoprotein-anchoring transpeptidase ErfK/SrfK|uniref:L,D-transpeptidase n=1 Tax=unclassified Mesorhizobium TaxID=325217 RepID=UPI000FCB1347|nr:MULTISPECIES: L,D-transpeptidase [unclassified Mesorhizobium]RUX97094.1 L,D-transpeptidase [Mesorhizobium sp. M7D.F.Ca.US.004.01.2.1]RVA31161.1 L,D-transpeptidase [Mesorhizobium sp. M7D.F.Ca.US.004.03.1.1]
MSFLVSRRSLLTGLSLIGVSTISACAQFPKQSLSVASPLIPAPLEPTPEKGPIEVAGPEAARASPDYANMYAAVEDGGRALPAIPFAKVDERFLRQIVVDDPTGEKPGTLVVNTTDKYLYWVLKDGKAMRYGVGLGRQGYSWKGRAIVQWKRKWPTWTPPSTMISRDPKLEKWRQGMPPGISNPLGSRALYIFKDGVDTLYRIHGSPDWKSIGKSASSGCVRMFNQDVMDLYDRVPSKTPLLVI